MENLTDSHGGQASSLEPKLKELLGRVTSRHSSDAEIWRQYALLYGDGHSSNPEDNEKVGAEISISPQRVFNILPIAATHSQQSHCALTTSTHAVSHVASKT